MIEYTVRVYDNGDKHWYLNGERHREDGPAVEWAGTFTVRNLQKQNTKLQPLSIPVRARL